MDRIVLEGLEFHGYHGVFEEESKMGARFVVDVELSLSLPERDSLRQTVDYSRVYAMIRREVTEKRYKLIEALAAKIAGSVLESEARVQSVVVRVHKPHAPLPGVVRDVFVEVRRERD